MMKNKELSIFDPVTMAKSTIVVPETDRDAYRKQMATFEEWSRKSKMAYIDPFSMQVTEPKTSKSKTKAKPEEPIMASPVVEVLDISQPLSVVMFGDEVKQKTAKVIDRMMATSGDNSDSFTIIDQVKRTFGMMNGITFKKLPEKDPYLSRIFQFVKTREEIRSAYVVQYTEANREFNNINKKMETVRDRIIKSISDLKELMNDNVDCLGDIAHKERSVNDAMGEIAEDHPMRGKLQDKLDSFNILKISINQTNTQLDLIVKNHMTIIEKINDINTMVFPIWKRQFFVMNTLLEQKEFTDATRLQVENFEQDQKQLNTIMTSILKK